MENRDINLVVGEFITDADRSILEDLNPFLTETTWLPTILCSLGFFTSNSQVKRDRPDLCFEVPIGLLTFDDGVFAKIKSPLIFKSIGKKRQSVFILRRR